MYSISCALPTRLREACNFVLITKVVTSNKMYSYFHLATDDKDINFFVNKVCMLYSGGPHPVVVNPSRPSCSTVHVVDQPRPSISTPVAVVFNVVICHLPRLHLPMPHRRHCWYHTYPLATVLRKYIYLV